MEQKLLLASLASKASAAPYYKYNDLWSRQLQTAAFCSVFCAWLGCDLIKGGAYKKGSLLSLESVGDILGVPVNVKDQDVFHLTIEEYLHSLITLINEMSRLAVNSVTIGDYEMPLMISKFIKELFSAFQVLNLKNDNLRRRYDSVKYDVKKVEEVVYDLSLRGLIKSDDNYVEVAPAGSLQNRPAVPYLKVKLLTPSAKMPTRGSAHAAGYDLYAASAIRIDPGGRGLVSTGISIAIPVDSYARIAPRSGLAVKNGIQTGAGVVDSDYRGEVKVLLFNQGDAEFKVNEGDRIAQLLLEKVYTPEVEGVENLEESVRGAGGFGSTGA